MKSFHAALMTVLCSLGLVACNQQQPVVQQTPPPSPVFQAIAAKLTIADKQVDSVVMWNTQTGEARLLNAASFADKTTGQQGNLVGWVPLTDLNQAVQNLATQIQAQQAKKPATSSSAPSGIPSSTPIMPKK